MNTARIAGAASGIYGVGATPAPPFAERFPFVSEFVKAVGAAASGYTLADAEFGTAAPIGGTYGDPKNIRRYVVGGFADAAVIRANPGRARAQSAALLFADANRYALSNGFILGFWVDEATGRIWLDVCCAYDYRPEAFDAATENGELAFHDSELEEDVRLS